MENSLIKMNFAPGIKADKVNYNFDLIHEWIKRDRQRVAGFGLVDGFDVSINTDTYDVTIGAGTMITPEGEEMFIDQKVFSAGAPEYVEKEERIICPYDGVIKLGDIPYSPTNIGHIDYRPPVTTDMPSSNEFSILCEDLNSRVYYLQISDNTVYISKPETWINKELTFKYLSCDDRVDAIIMLPNGTYKYERSIVSKNPSHVDISDYPKNSMLVSVIHWKIGTKLEVKVYDNHRSYRKVFVDKDNNLYINGKLYKEAQMIYFTPPETPQENDLWYDTSTNCLMVWRESLGDWGWVLVNDISTISTRETKMYTPIDWPVDSQTFIFDDSETNMKYVPNTNALTIIVDQQILMSDQYTEIISKTHGDAPDYLSQGVGFKLVEPLDHPTYVQVIVTHQVRSKPVRETFQRAAIFIDENHAYKSKDNVQQVFKTEYPYVVGAQQLEVWVDGIRLTPGVDFHEMVNEKTLATADDMAKETLMSSYYTVAKTLADKQCVGYRVSKYVWSYDQIAQLIGDTTSDIKLLKNQCTTLQAEIDTSNKNVSEQIDALSKRIGDDTHGQANIGSSSIVLDNLTSEVRSKLIGNQIDMYMPATSLSDIIGATLSDYIQVHLIGTSNSRILVKNVDYTLAVSRVGVSITLIPEHAIAGNTIYVTGFRIGA